MACVEDLKKGSNFSATVEEESNDEESNDEESNYEESNDD